MKKLSVIILASIIALSFTSCSSDDEKAAEASLTAKPWKLSKLEINLVDQTSTLDKCDLMDTYNFTDDGKFSFTGHELESSSNCSSTVVTGTWVEDNSVKYSRRFNATFDGDEKSFLLIIEGDILREDINEGPDEEGGYVLYSYYYSRK